MRERESEGGKTLCLAVWAVSEISVDETVWAEVRSDARHVADNQPDSALLVLIASWK